MQQGRLEVFSDCVIAIILTIMVLELRVPHGEAWSDLAPLYPVFLSYVLSFLNLGGYWVNHHHMLQRAHKVNGAVLWANLHLLFWLSLIPFGTAWMGENHFAPKPVFLYGLDLLMCAVAYAILEAVLTRLEGKDSDFTRALGRGAKETVSGIAHAVAVALALFVPWVSLAIYFGVALVWVIPDRRFERIVR